MGKSIVAPFSDSVASLYAAMYILHWLTEVRMEHGCVSGG